MWFDSLAREHGIYSIVNGAVPLNQGCTSKLSVFGFMTSVKTHIVLACMNLKQLAKSFCFPSVMHLNLSVYQSEPKVYIVVMRNKDKEMCVL